MILRLWLLVVLACVGAFAPSRACARTAETRIWDFLATATNARPETEPQVAGTHLGFAACGYELASGYSQAAERGGGLFNSTMRQVENLNFSTGRNQAVFYSGPGNRARALSFADRTGAMPIDRTPGGQFLESLKLYDNLPAAQADAIWSRASQIYAGGAQGRINLFINGARPDRVFNMVERPLLDANIDVYRWTFHY